jgi:hypothetical protein
MKLFGFEIIVRRVGNGPSPLERMIEGADMINAAWNDLRSQRIFKYHPWTNWENHRVDIMESTRESSPVGRYTIQEDRYT